MDRARLLVVGAIGFGLGLFLTASLSAQPYSAQIQQALRAFTGSAQTFTAPVSATVFQPTTGYKSVDGTTGATVTTCTGFKNGLCISGT
jgi:ABC-type transport system substrate-binding protein